MGLFLFCCLIIISSASSANTSQFRISRANPYLVSIQLEVPKEANYLKLVFPNNKDKKGYNYYVEVSADNLRWQTIVDYSKYECNSIQQLYFPRQMIKYINIVGVDCKIELNEFQIKLENSVPRTLNGIIYPRYNVATEEMGAWTAQNIMINGVTNDYGSYHGYAEHQIPGEGLLIRLNQPYLIDSLNLLLYDKSERNRYYQYYIDVSVDNRNWIRILDKTRGEARSWQNYRFQPLIAMYIKIVGTYNSENDHFHVVHFESPSQHLESAKYA